MPLSNEVRSERAGSTDPEDPRWQLVERIVSSPCFQKSERLKAFLKYVVQQHVAGHSAALTGVEIGKAVFGKDAFYDQSEDNTVRIHARQLRLRLLEYFDTYGQREPLIVEVPKGAYVPVFRPNSAHPESSGYAVERLAGNSHSPAVGEVGAQGIVIKSRLLQWLPWALVAGLSIALGALLWRTPDLAPHRTTDAALELWPLSELTAHGSEAHVILCDNSYALFSATRGQHFHLADYLNPEYPRNIDPQIATIHDAGVASLFEQLRRKQLTSYADSATVAMIMQLGRRGAWSTKPARDLNLRDLQNGNYLFLGSSWANPWVELYEPRLNFVVSSRGALAVLNRRPFAGEKPAYVAEGATGDAGNDYAAIALIPNEKKGVVMILQGIKEEGTEAAGMFITGPKGRRALREKLGVTDADLDQTFFEAVIRTDTFDGASAETALVTARRVPGLARLQ